MRVPDFALLVCLVQDLLSGSQHVLQPLVVDHAPRLIMAQGADQDDLEHQLGWGA